MLEYTHVLITPAQGTGYVLPFLEYLRTDPPAHSTARLMTLVEAETWRARRQAVCS